MKGRFLTAAEIAEFKNHLTLEERSAATIEKYIRDVSAFAVYAQEAAKTVIGYKKHLQERYAVRSVNAMLAGLNGFFAFHGWNDLKVKTLKLQQQVYCPEEKELSEIFQVWSGWECFVLEDAAVRERLTAYTEKAARWHQALASECKNPYFKKILTDAARYCISYACTLAGQEAQENVLREILLAETEQERQRRMRQYFQSLSEHIVRQWKGETEWH